MDDKQRKFFYFPYPSLGSCEWKEKIAWRVKLLLTSGATFLTVWLTYHRLGLLPFPLTKKTAISVIIKQTMGGKVTSLCSFFAFSSKLEERQNA